MIRKPHNLVTAYWDDCDYFYYNLDEIKPQQIENYSYISPQHKRPIRYTILSSFLFLEAFINAEYFSAEGFIDPRTLTEEERKKLYNAFRHEKFQEKWSSWIENFCGKGKLNLKGTNQYQNIKKLESWRNQLTHYKIHDLILVANDIEIIENAREAHKIATESILWYFDLTKKKVPAWITRDVFKLKLRPDIKQ